MFARLLIAGIVFCFIGGVERIALGADSGAVTDQVNVDITAAHKIITFTPWQAIGSTVDKEPAGSIPSLYSAHNVHLMLEPGLGWLSYRLYTELSDQDWHWNPNGKFSAGSSGYWISDASTAIAPIADSYGYQLPHTGNTSDQGDNKGYSRLDDGDPLTYWKSDPYLTRAYTGDPDSVHPQWGVVDLGQVHTIDTIRISWANPYATRYTIATWSGDDPMGDPATSSSSTVFTSDARSAASVGSKAGALGPIHDVRLHSPVSTRFVGLFMTTSSGTCDTHGPSDKRNCMGYAIGELAIGRTDASGSFHDYVIHKPCGGISPTNPACGQVQSTTYVSSVDPWHDASNRVHYQEQPGLDLIARSGLTRAQPAMYPVPMLYSTPENAVAEVRYLRARGYPILGIELGEEPDGQYTAPEDDAALYVQWARAIHRVDPTLRLGGPVFSGVDSELQTWPDAAGNLSWLNRFLAYLRAHNALGELSFMSFEHYPSDNGCVHGEEMERDLLIEPSIVKGVINAWRSDGVPASVPLYITEAGFSSVNFTQAPMQIEGALWQADYMASALSYGVSKVVYYQYEPVPLSQNQKCPSDWGNLTMFVADSKANIRARGATFFASQMIAQEWLQPGNRTHDLYPASTNVRRDGYPLMTAYAAHRPDGSWSVMLVNKDTKPRSVAVAFSDGATGQSKAFTSEVTMVTFGPAQYVWHARGAASAPAPEGPPARQTLSASSTYTIPARSITVLRGAIGPVQP